MEKDTQKKQILEQFLSISAFDGWSSAALKQAGKACGLTPEYTEILFPEGVKDITRFYLQQQNIRLYEYAAQTPDFENKKVREKIAELVWQRIQNASQHKPAAKKLMAYLALPQHYCDASKYLWNTADTIWKAAGDKSTDFNYYTKRMTLCGVYSSTLLFWLNDTSGGAKETHAFLLRRLKNVMQFHQAKHSFKQKVANIFG